MLNIRSITIATLFTTAAALSHAATPSAEPAKAAPTATAATATPTAPAAKSADKAVVKPVKPESKRQVKHEAKPGAKTENIVKTRPAVKATSQARVH